jgi:hypothetical protein
MAAEQQRLEAERTRSEAEDLQERADAVDPDVDLEETTAGRKPESRG